MENLACPLCGETETLGQLYAAAKPDRPLNITGGVSGSGGHIRPELNALPPLPPVTCAWCGCVYSPAARREADCYRSVAARYKEMHVDSRIANQMAGRKES